MRAASATRSRTICRVRRTTWPRCSRANASPDGFYRPRSSSLNLHRRPGAAKEALMAAIRVGIGGWGFPPWRGFFSPAGLAQSRELAHASRQVTSIEINGTFYGSQKPTSFQKWYAETPDDYVFSVKGD